MSIKLSFTHDGRMVGRLAPSPSIPYGRYFVEVIDPVTSQRLTRMANSRRLQYYLQAASMIGGQRHYDSLAFHQFQPEVDARLSWKNKQPTAHIRGYRLIHPSYGTNPFDARVIYRTMLYSQQLATIRELYVPYHICGRGIWLFSWDTSLLSRSQSRFSPIDFNACHSINDFGQLV